MATPSTEVSKSFWNGLASWLPDFFSPLLSILNKVGEKLYLVSLWRLNYKCADGALSLSCLLIFYLALFRVPYKKGRVDVGGGEKMWLTGLEVNFHELSLHLSSSLNILAFIYAPRFTTMATVFWEWTLQNCLTTKLLSNGLVQK